MCKSESVEAHGGIGDESNALKPARVREAHHVQILDLPTEAPILTDGIHLQSTIISLESIPYGKPSLDDLWPKTHSRAICNTICQLHTADEWCCISRLNMVED